MFLIFNYLNFKSLNFQDFEVVRILLNWMKMDQGSGRGRGEKEIEREKERERERERSEFQNLFFIVLLSDENIYFWRTLYCLFDYPQNLVIT